MKQVWDSNKWTLLKAATLAGVFDAGWYFGPWRGFLEVIIFTIIFNIAWILLDLAHVNILRGKL